MALARAALQRGVVDLTFSMGAVLALGFAQNLILARNFASLSCGCK